jgi:hypothetical protein
VFTATDMQRFTNTLTRTMWNGSLTAPVVSRLVDGTGDPSLSMYLVEWTELAQWAKAIFPIVAEQYRNRNVGNSYTMLALARIMQWDRSKMVNRGFELATSFDAAQPAQWNKVGSTPVRDQDNAYSGQYGLTIRSVVGSAQQVYQSWEGWQPGTAYLLSFVGKASGAAGGRVWVYDETSDSVLVSVPFTDADWTAMSVDFVAPSASTDVVRVYVGNADATAEGSTHVDDVKLKVATDSW